MEPNNITLINYYIINIILLYFDQDSIESSYHLHEAIIYGINLFRQLDMTDGVLQCFRFGSGFRGLLDPESGIQIQSLNKKFKC